MKSENPEFKPAAARVAHRRFACRFAEILLAACLANASPVAAALKIACVGDSITEGAGLGNPATESYPAKLQRLLGSDYQVVNYGVGGRTLLKKGDFPYWNEAAYRQSLDSKPDVVIIKLGTNDSKPQNWRYATNFVPDYEALIASYTNLASHPRILLCTPCPVYKTGAYDIRPGIVATNIAPAVRDLAGRFGLELIDLQTNMAGHLEWFPDTVHPNSRGTTVMAALVRTALMRGYPLDAPPPLGIERGLSSRALLRWPSEWGGLVLQSTPALRGTNTSWTVVEQVAFNDGSSIHVTNVVSGTARIYRLWSP